MGQIPSLRIPNYPGSPNMWKTFYSSYFYENNYRIRKTRAMGWIVKIKSPVTLWIVCPL
jgi:hypothetical protein